jgi:CheY-like chemotaxis protein
MTSNRFEIPTTSARALARILLVDADATSRMTLKTVLTAGGYDVTISTTTVDALERLDMESFELVLCQPGSGQEAIDPAVLSYARFQDYEPATALLHTVHCSADGDTAPASSREVLVQPQDLPDLLENVAALIGARALTLLEREFQPGGTIC